VATREATLAPTVPFLDLQTIHAELKDSILADIDELIEHSGFINGPAVDSFEKSFARFCGTRHGVGVGSGLDALRLGLIASGIEAGDEVIVPANTFVATFEAVSQAGGIPVPVDVSETDYNLDPAAATAAVGPRTRFVLPVHLYGQMADMRTLGAFATAHGLAVLEDACQAHGAERDGVLAGTAGRAGAFSFYPGKNLGAMGDAGALVTDDAEIAGLVRELREHGQRVKYVHEREGWTARLDTIQAIVLSHKLPRLVAWNAQRARIASHYTEALDDVGDLVAPPVPVGSHPVWHLYVVRTRDPHALAAHLAARGVATGRHYPEPAHLSPAYAHLGLRAGSLPVTEQLARELLSLPIFPGMTEGQVDTVVDCVRAYFARG
jgi:dTDP-3-amino-3,4,6-trideoxy-alpha-D-glucose transaminase